MERQIDTQVYSLISLLAQAAISGYVRGTRVCVASSAGFLLNLLWLAVVSDFVFSENVRPKISVWALKPYFYSWLLSFAFFLVKELKYKFIEACTHFSLEIFHLACFRIVLSDRAVKLSRKAVCLEITPG